MILSSADILRILGKNEVIRLSAKISVVDGRPALSGREGVYIYINRFPTVSEFEATWQIWIEADEEDDLIVAELQRLLPRVQVTRGLITTVSTTEFRSESTQQAPETSRQAQAQVDLKQYEERFQELVEDVQDRMLLVHSGRPGKDGRDGRDGADGRDGRDIEVSETRLEDLANVDEGLTKEDGQVLTWKNGEWTNLFVPQLLSTGGGIAFKNIQGIEIEGASDGDIIRYDETAGEWVAVAADLDANADGGDFGPLPNPDGGDFDDATTTSTLAYPVDGGDFNAGTTDAFGDESFDGGVAS